MIIAIDGLGVNGKSTLAKRIADKFGFKYFNTGAIYRCIALKIINEKLNIENIEEVIEYLKNITVDFINEKVILDGRDVTEKIRTEQISVKSTKWATLIPIKQLVRKIQKDFLEKNDTVIEGRDICTRIAPNADVKFYLYSDFETRVNRLWNSNQKVSIDLIRKDLLIRDKLDIDGGNFIKPKNAIEIDTSQMSIEQVYNTMIEKINITVHKNKKL